MLCTLKRLKPKTIDPGRKVLSAQTFLSKKLKETVHEECHLAFLLYCLFGNIIDYKLFFLQNELVLKLDHSSKRDLVQAISRSEDSGGRAIVVDFIAGWSCQVSLDIGCRSRYLSNYPLSSLAAENIALFFSSHLQKISQQLR